MFHTCMPVRGQYSMANPYSPQHQHAVTAGSGLEGLVRGL